MKHCPNTVAAADYAHSQGKQDALDSLADSMLETLESGGTVWIDMRGESEGFTAGDILSARPGKPIQKALADWCNMSVTAHLDYLKRINEEDSAERALEDVA